MRVRRREEKSSPGLPESSHHNATRRASRQRNAGGLVVRPTAIVSKPGAHHRKRDRLEGHHYRETSRRPKNEKDQVDRLRQIVLLKLIRPKEPNRLLQATSGGADQVDHLSARLRVDAVLAYRVLTALVDQENRRKAFHRRRRRIPRRDEVVRQSDHVHRLMQYQDRLSELKLRTQKVWTMTTLTTRTVRKTTTALRSRHDSSKGVEVVEW